VTVYTPGTDEKDLTKFAYSLQQLASGRSNAVGVVTLTDGATTTTVNTDNCAAGSGVSLTPNTAHAAAEIGNGTIYVTAANRSFVITHANNAQTDRTFTYAIQG
jgi:hypothetical protein